MASSDGHTLDAFLQDSSNSLSREAMTRYRLYGDLKVAAALHAYDLQISESDVDRHGYDCMFDDGDLPIRAQLKTIHVSSSTKNLKLHAGLIKPGRWYPEKIGFPPDHSGCGYGGGAILMYLSSCTSGLNIDYYYLNAHLLVASIHGVNPLSRCQQQTAKRLRASLVSATSTQLVSFPSTAFTPAKSPCHLLALMGLHSTVQTSYFHNLHLVSAMDASPQLYHYEIIRDHIMTAGGFEAPPYLPTSMVAKRDRSG